MLKYTDKIIAFENGDLDRDETIALFQAGINGGWVWQLQGAYGRLAIDFIEAGLCSLPDGCYRVSGGPRPPRRYQDLAEAVKDADEEEQIQEVDCRGEFLLVGIVKHGRLYSDKGHRIPLEE